MRNIKGVYTTLAHQGFKKEKSFKDKKRKIRKVDAVNGITTVAHAQSLALKFLKDH